MTFAPGVPPGTMKGEGFAGGAMGYRTMKSGRALALALALVGASACVVNEPEAPTRGVVVSGPPPAPVTEQPPPPPGPQATWVPGYWHWTGMQYAWIPGHWETPPPGTAWTAPTYTQRDGRVVYESGGWRPSSPAGPGNRSALR